MRARKMVSFEIIKVLIRLGYKISNLLGAWYKKFMRSYEVKPRKILEDSILRDRTYRNIQNFL